LPEYKKKEFQVATENNEKLVLRIKELEIENKTLTERVSFLENNSLKCDVCGKVCKSELGLISHKRSHK